MSFPVDDFGMNIRAEVKAYNFGFSTAKNLASVIRANDKVTVVSFALPTHACFRPNGLGICPQNVTIIANSRYADQALELKQAYPELRIFLDPRIHAKMTLASSGKVWLGSANMAMSNSLDSTIGIESPAVYAYFMDQIRRSGLLCPETKFSWASMIPSMTASPSVPQRTSTIWMMTSKEGFHASNQERTPEQAGQGRDLRP